MADERQTSFSAGELSPLLWGRTDLEIYRKGARTLKNRFVSKTGAAVSRPGTLKVATAKLPDVALLPFVYSDTEAFILEAGEYYLRVLSLDGVLVQELTAPWRSSEVGALQYAQAGYVMTIAHPAIEPLELRAPQPGVSSTWLLVAARFEPPGDTPSSTQSLTPVFKDVLNNLRLGPMLQGGVGLFVLDAAHPPREWRYLVSAIMRHNLTGEEIETLPVQIGEYYDGVSRSTVASLPADNLLVLFPDAPIRLSHPTFGPLIGTLSDHANWSPVGIVYYRGRGSLYGFIGTTRYAQPFIDFGEEPDYTRQPLRGEAPFQPGSLSSYSPKPAAVTYFQQRRAFALDQRVSLSATDEWANHDRPIPPFIVDSSPLDYTFIGRRRESARALISHRRLLVFTDTSVWSLGSGDDGALTPATASLRLEDEVGAASLMPLVIDGMVLYVSAKSRGVRALSFARGDAGGYVSQDVSWVAEHLFRKETIVSWCYQREPWGVVWAARSDGALLSLSRSGDGVLGWARHFTGERTENGEVVADEILSVCSLPDGAADAVYVAVRRGSSTYIERLFRRENETPAQISDDMGDADFAVDSAISASVDVDVDDTISGLDHLEGREVWVCAPGNPPRGPYTVAAGSIDVEPISIENDPDNPGTVACMVGLPFTADLGLLDAPWAHLNQKTTVKVGFEVDSSRGGLFIGEESDRLHEWRHREVADSYDNPGAASVLAVIAVSGKWQRSGRAFVRQARPIGTTILGVIREVAVGGK